MAKKSSASPLLGAALIAALALVQALLIGAGTAATAAEPMPPAAAAGKNTCVECHSDTRFLVQNKKLYDYYRDWSVSIHALNDVTCSGCHGGNPRAADKSKAHAGGALQSARQGSPINYRNIPDLCAQCHKEIFQRFKLSAHYDNLTSKDEAEQGPNCVTCHGSVNTAVLTVTTVRQTCEKCHNAETDNHPDMPDRAESVLNNFLSIKRYYRYIALRSSPEDAQTFTKIMDPMVRHLNAEWHSFDIDVIDEKTHELVRFLKARRNDMKRAGAKKSP